MKIVIELEIDDCRGCPYFDDKSKSESEHPGFRPDDHTWGRCSKMNLGLNVQKGYLPVYCPFLESK